MNNLQEIQELAGLVQKIREADKDLRVSGAGDGGHEHILRPCLSEEEIKQFEVKHNICLPEDYRLFLQHVGNGGPGPDYGMTSLGEGGYTFKLDEPFTYLEEVDFVKTPGESANFAGILEVSDGGCSYYSYIVVTGPTRGQVWNAHEMGIVPTGLTFSQWYRHWAERALEILANEPLAERIKIGMTRSEVIEVTNSNWNERKGGEATLFENPRIAAQLYLNEEKVVVRIIRYEF